MANDSSPTGGDWRIDTLQTVGILVGVVLALVTLNLILRRLMPKRHLLRQLIMLALTPLLLVPAIMAFVDSPEARFRVLGLLGVLISAAITLGSTTFIGNALAGIMLRVVNNFRLGDFIETGELKGWVSERGLFHVEIQNEEKDLTTIPNLFLVTHPVTVIRTREETVVSADLSLGYDVPRGLIKELLQEAAIEADLEKPVVRIRELGDFSVTYSVAGILSETAGLLTARSRLMGRILDVLHGAGVEIVSPTFMNTRAYAHGRQFIPQRHGRVDEEGEISIEEIALEKAKTAGSIQDLEERHDRLEEAIKACESEISKTDDEAEREASRREFERLTAERDDCAAEIEALKAAREEAANEPTTDVDPEDR
jgi:small-conductance mechanosensitive channel